MMVVESAWVGTYLEYYHKNYCFCDSIVHEVHFFPGWIINLLTVDAIIIGFIAAELYFSH